MTEKEINAKLAQCHNVCDGLRFFVTLTAKDGEAQLWSSTVEFTKQLMEIGAAFNYLMYALGDSNTVVDFINGASDEQIRKTIKQGQKIALADGYKGKSAGWDIL